MALKNALIMRLLQKLNILIVKFLHYNHLITCKKAGGRPQDLVDIEELEKIRKAGEGNNP